MAECGIPTARHKTFDDPSAAIRYLSQAGFPKFIKADGLALGKGAVEVDDFARAQEVIADMMVRGALGVAGWRGGVNKPFCSPHTPPLSSPPPPPPPQNL